MHINFASKIQYRSKRVTVTGYWEYTQRNYSNKEIL
jgi:hypothetical protein